MIAFQKGTDYSLFLTDDSRRSNEAEVRHHLRTECTGKTPNHSHTNTLMQPCIQPSLGDSSSKFYENTDKNPLQTRCPAHVGTWTKHRSSRLPSSHVLLQSIHGPYSRYRAKYRYAIQRHNTTVAVYPCTHGRIIFLSTVSSAPKVHVAF